MSSLIVTLNKGKNKEIPITTKYLNAVYPTPKYLTIPALPITIDAQELAIERMNTLGDVSASCGIHEFPNGDDLGAYDYDTAVFCIEVIRYKRILYIYGACKRPVHTLLAYLAYLRRLSFDVEILKLVHAADPLDIVRRADIYVEQNDCGKYDSFFGRVSRYNISAHLEIYAERTRGLSAYS